MREVTSEDSVDAVTHPTIAMWQGPIGLQLFASARGELHSRRPTDVVLLVVGAIVLVVTGGMRIIAADFEQALGDLIGSLPGLLDPLWQLTFWIPLAWCAFILVVATARRRGALTRDLVLALLVALFVGFVVAALVADGGQSIGDILLATGPPPAYPIGAVTVAAALLSTASPHLARPFRNAGRWLVAFQFLASIALGAALPSGAFAAVAIGISAAAIIHLWHGSPGGRPTPGRIRLAMTALGVDVAELVPTAMQGHGVVLFDAASAGGPLQVKVYGRDAWDAQLLTNVWRSIWYRGAGYTFRLSRVDLVEHEAFVNLLADRAGVRVPKLVTAGSAGRGDALLVVEPLGVPLVDVDDGRRFDPASLWEQLGRLHRAGIAHGRLDLDRVVITADGSVGFGDLSSAEVATRGDELLKDRAQALALTLVTLGEPDAVSAAAAALGQDFAAIIPYVQPAAMPPGVRDLLDERDIDLDDVRDRLNERVGAPEQPLIKLRRVTVGSIVNLGLLALAAYTLIALLGDLDLKAFLEALRDANWWWLALALVLAQLPRFPAAVSTMGSTRYALPLGPLVALQFAICYVNLAIPSTAARVAVNVRFFQRFGAPPTAAMSAGVIDSLSGMIVQVGLFLSVFFLSDIDLGLSADMSDLGGLATVAMIVLALVVAAVLVIMAVPAIRRRVLAVLGDVWEAVQVLRSPTKLLQLFGGNVLSQVMFAIALGACVRGFGAQVALSELVLINTVVTLFAGLLPIPGGMGVSEAGLTLGLTRAGLPSEIAFAAALAYRFASFYLPPIWGWFCYRGLVQRRYL